jgi:hypothetical protein
MPSRQQDKPRPHHYQFAHRALPAISRNPQVDLAALARSGRLNGALRATWTAVGERLQEPDRLSGDGLHGELADLAGEQAIVVTLPPARHATEAFFAVITPLDPLQARRYLTLEFSWNVVTSQPATVVGEWQADRHINHGDGTGADRSALIAKVQQLLSG